MTEEKIFFLKKQKGCLQQVEEFMRNAKSEGLNVLERADGWYALEWGKTINSNGEVIDDTDYLAFLKNEYKQLNRQFVSEEITRRYSITNQINIVSDILISLIQSTDASFLSEDQKQALNNFILFVKNKEILLEKNKEYDSRIDNAKTVEELRQYLLSKQLENEKDS